MNYIDLHVHSTRSDGSYTPKELVDYAVEKKLTAFALTDHDTIAGVDEAIAYAKDKAIQVIPGIELSTDYDNGTVKSEVHMVGIDIKYNDPGFQVKLLDFYDSRDLRNIKMCQKLSEHGMPMTYAQLIETFPESVITRAHVARLMVQKGYVSEPKKAFDKWIGLGKPCYVPREKITPEDGVRLILAGGGIPILAHPMLYKMTEKQLEEMIAPLKEAGLIGIEGIYSTYTPADDACVRRLAKKFDLTISGGSDFHGLAKPGLDLGTGYGKLRVPEEILTGLREAKKRTEVSHE